MPGRFTQAIKLHHERGGDAVWTGTLEEFWKANPDMLFGEIREVADLLDQYGETTVGGGAAATTFVTRG